MAEGWRGKIGAMDPERRDFYLEGSALVRVSAINEDGFPHIVPAWYHWDGTAFWLVLRERAEIAEQKAVLAQSLQELQLSLDSAHEELKVKAEGLGWSGLALASGAASESCCGDDRSLPISACARCRRDTASSLA